MVFYIKNQRSKFEKEADEALIRIRAENTRIIQEFADANTSLTKVVKDLIQESKAQRAECDQLKKIFKDENEKFHQENRRIIKEFSDSHSSLVNLVKYFILENEKNKEKE